MFRTPVLKPCYGTFIIRLHKNSFTTSMLLLPSLGLGGIRLVYFGDCKYQSIEIIANVNHGNTNTGLGVGVTKPISSVPLFS